MCATQRAVSVALLATLLAATAGAAAEPATTAAPSGTDEAPHTHASKLATEFSDPLTTLPQIFTQDAYTPANFGTAAQANRWIVRAIVPRIPKFSLLPFVQLIRPSVSLVTVPTSKGKGTRTEFGDMQLFDLAVIPWPDRESGLLMGVGPLLVFPTATHESAGDRARGRSVPRLRRSTRASRASSSAA